MAAEDGRRDARMSRREAGRAAAAALAGAVLTTCVPAGGQAPAAPPAATDTDTRLALIEKSLGRTLSAEQRKAVLEGIKGTDDGWTKGRAEFTVPDGTEPDFVFRPTPLAPAGKERPHA